MAYSGKYVVKDKTKYKGDSNNVTYRSTWEKFFMEFLDKNPSIARWNSESVIIPYFCNAEGKKRRYFMDFWFKDTDGQEFFVEIKPYKETIEPKSPVNLTVKAKKNFMNELYTYSVNSDKWRAAKKVADERGIIFRVLTEVGLAKMGFKGVYK